MAFKIFTGHHGFFPPTSHLQLLPGDAHGTDGAIHLLRPHPPSRAVDLRLQTLRATVRLGHAGHLHRARDSHGDGDVLVPTANDYIYIYTYIYIYMCVGILFVYLLIYLLFYLFVYLLIYLLILFMHMYIYVCEILYIALVKLVWLYGRTILVLMILY